MRATWQAPAGEKVEPADDVPLPAEVLFPDVFQHRQAVAGTLDHAAVRAPLGAAGNGQVVPDACGA